MKLAFSCNAFVQFTGMFDVIFKFTVPLRQLRGHHVNSRRRIVPAGWSISDRLAEVELMGHVARPEAYDPFRDCPIRRHIKAGSYVSTCLHSGQAKSEACRNQGDGLSRGEGAVDIGITSPQYEQLTVTYHLSGSMRSFKVFIVRCDVTVAGARPKSSATSRLARSEVAGFEPGPFRRIICR